MFFGITTRPALSMAKRHFVAFCDGITHSIVPRSLGYTRFLGLREGSDIEMEETPEGLMLKPVETRPSMIKKDGLWVHTGKVPPGFDVVQAIREDREERIRKLSGL